MDRQVSAVCVLCWGLWIACLALWGIAWITSSPDLSNLALIVCGGAVTVSIKCFLIEQHAKFKSALAVTSTVTQVRTLH